MMEDNRKDDGEGAGFRSPAPSIALPQGGGAIRGIGEKFAANPVTGTGSMTVPLPLSPGRSGFSPRLTLSHDSGAGNGPFGYGWTLDLPAIARKTENGLPRYADQTESDVFLLSGAEDLVPLANPDGTRRDDDLSAKGYAIRRYRPRVGAALARIERWTNRSTGEVHWRTISGDNVTTVFGEDAGSRIADPGDPARVYSWLVSSSYDDKGNLIVYEYAGEDDANVDRRLANERNRKRGAARYLKRVKYGNRVSRLVEPDPGQAQWLFEAVFDYGEDHVREWREGGEENEYAKASVDPGRAWEVRPDPFSFYRSGFELRTYRRCRRVLMFHRFDELGLEPYLVRGMEFDYGDFDYVGSGGEGGEAPSAADELAHPGSTRLASFLRGIVLSGYVRDDARTAEEEPGPGDIRPNVYRKQSLPPLEFEYSQAVIREEVRDMDPDSLDNLPGGIGEPVYRWADLHGEGLTGLLAEQAGAWFYKPNLGVGRLGPLEKVGDKPASATLENSASRLLDFTGDGQLDLAVLSSEATGLTGLYERTPEGEWGRWRPFENLPIVDWNDPNLVFVDLDGDGVADLLLSGQDDLIWHPSLAKDGFDESFRVPHSLDEEAGPKLLIADGTSSVYLADMNGDGLTDLVRIRNGEVCYWPNLGYGKFGAKVAMDRSPWLDEPDRFSQKRIRLADLDGSGVADLVYLAADGARLIFNQSGNGWSEPYLLRGFPSADSLSSVQVVDLLGSGTACLVWSSFLYEAENRSLRYVDLMGGEQAASARADDQQHGRRDENPLRSVHEVLYGG